MKAVSKIIVAILLNISFSILSQTIVVTGGAGFIGSHVVHRLLERGDKVIVIDNFFTHADLTSHHYDILKKIHLNELMSQYPEQLQIYVCDICDKEQIDTIFAQHKPTLICHLAACAGVRYSLENPLQYMTTNVNGTVSILEMAKKHNINHVVLASSSSVYGERDEVPFNERQKTDTQTSPYGVSKKMVELLGYVYHYLYGISCSCLRFFTVYGPYGRFDMAPFIFMDAIYNEEPITVYGTGDAIRDFTYVDDIVSGVIKALDKPLGYHIFNLGCSQPILLSDFIQLLEETIGKRAHILYQDSFKADVSQTYANVDKAKKMLGYQPKVSIKEGIARMYTWYLQYAAQLKKLRHAQRIAVAV